MPSTFSVFIYRILLQWPLPSNSASRKSCRSWFCYAWQWHCSHCLRSLPQRPCSSLEVELHLYYYTDISIRCSLCWIIPDPPRSPWFIALGSQVQLCRHQQLPTGAEDVQMGCLCAGEGTPGRRREDLFCKMSRYLYRNTLLNNLVNKSKYKDYKVLLNVCDFLVGYPHEMKLEVHCW